LTVWLVSGYAQVFKRLSVFIVILSNAPVRLDFSSIQSLKQVLYTVFQKTVPTLVLWLQVACVDKLWQLLVLRFGIILKIIRTFRYC